MDDLISRKDAINYMANVIWHYPNYTALNVYENAEELAKDGLANVPSAESTGAMDEAIQHYVNEGYMILDRPKSEWIEDDKQNHVEKTYHCSECGFKAWGEAEKTKFCGGCGAKMDGDIE